MSLHIVRSTHLEELAAALAEELAAAQRAEPFAPQAVVVGSAGLARWLRRRIARCGCVPVEVAMDEAWGRVVEAGEMRGPLGEVLVALREARNWQAMAEVLRGIPAGDALEALDALQTGRVPGMPKPLGVDFLVERTSLELADRIVAGQGATAIAILDRWSASSSEMPAPLACWAFVALARAGLRCAPSWERLFPCVRVGGIHDPTVPLVREAARTLPPARVLEITRSAMLRGPVAAPYTALSVLDVHDDEGLARHLLAYRSAAWTRERIVKALERRADRPGIRSALGSAAPRAIVLHVASRALVTSLEGLDATRREQLRIARDRFEGSARSAAEGLAAGVRDADEEACEHRVLADETGRPRYEPEPTIDERGVTVDLGSGPITIPIPR